MKYARICLDERLNYYGGGILLPIKSIRLHISLRWNLSILKRTIF